MRNHVIPVLVSLLVFASLSGVAVAKLATPESTDDVIDGSAPGEYVTFSDFSDWSVPPPASAPAVPQPGAPGPYTGPGEEAVPPGWSTWAMEDHNQCGSLRLIFGNQDLNREFQEEGGVVQAQGSFFIQFQAIGHGAEDITRFSFSFGKSHPELNDNSVLNCNSLIPDNPLGKGTAGVYIPFYRSDFNPDDGFFIPIETRNVPDGDYAAAVHAYTGEWPNYVEVARAWALAEVKNCEGTDANMDYCNGEDWDDHPAVIANDHTMPWPWVLPGDGAQTNEVDGLTIEILEPVVSLNASINGERVELEDWTPPPRDRDVLPLNDPDGELGGCPADQNTPPVCNHMVYSQGWKWEGPVDIGTIIQVEAVDRNGNEVFKSLYWDGIGGVIDVDFPDIDFVLESQPSQVIKAGEEFRYNIRVENVGGSEAHVDFWLSLEGGRDQASIDEPHIQAQWMDMSWDHGHATHLHMRSGQVHNIYVDITTNEETPNGTYLIEAALTYPALGETQRRSEELRLTIDGVIEQQEEEEPDDLDDEKTPGPAVLLAAAVVVGSLAALRRRQRRR